MLNKLTKIVATISDLRAEPEDIKKLYESGVNVIRLNTAHQRHEDTIKVIENVRKVSNQIAIMVDTKGPEVRTQNIENPIDVNENDVIFITKERDERLNSFQVNYEFFTEELDEGKSILIDDGEIEMKVIKKDKNGLECKVKNAGKIKNNKSVNTPQTKLKLNSVTEKDKGFIELAAKYDVDFIAHSFVRNREDVLAVENILSSLNSNVKVISKIENQEGIDNIEEIIKASYGIMIARGDLGVEIPAEQVPKAQINIIKACLKYASPVITATQMLHSMIENPRPTRAEVSDVANAILNGTDSVMLSGETAYGKYPLESVEMMSKIAKEMEEFRKNTFIKQDIFEGEKLARKYLMKAAVDALKFLPIKAIILDSLTGRTARFMATYRAGIPVYVTTNNLRIARELSLSYGIYPNYVDQTFKRTTEFVVVSLELLKKQGRLKDDDLVIILAGTPNRDLNQGTESIEINTVENAIRGRNLNI